MFVHASTAEAQESVGVEIAEAIAEVLQGGRIRNAINMPSIDPKDLITLSPYLDLCHRLGSFARQSAQENISSIHITFWGGIVDFDAVPLTRAVQKGWLAGLAGDEGINDVNAPHKIKALGIKLEVTKSSSVVDYNELIEVKTVSSDGTERSVKGTLLGKANDPRIVEVDQQVESFEGDEGRRTGHGEAGRVLFLVRFELLRDVVSNGADFGSQFLHAVLVAQAADVSLAAARKVWSQAISIRILSAIEVVSCFSRSFSTRSRKANRITKNSCFCWSWLSPARRSRYRITLRRRRWFVCFTARGCVSTSVSNACHHQHC